MEVHGCEEAVKAATLCFPCVIPVDAQGQVWENENTRLLS
jgi:hypothetical protein